MSNPAIPAVAKVGSAQGWGGGKSGCSPSLRLIPYPVAINTLGSLELGFSEVNCFGKVDKAVRFAVLKLFASLFKMSKCRMMMSFEYVAQNKSTSCRAGSSVQPSGVTWAINHQEVPVSGD